MSYLIKTILLERDIFLIRYDILYSEKKVFRNLLAPIMPFGKESPP